MLDDKLKKNSLHGLKIKFIKFLESKSNELENNKKFIDL